MDLIERYLHAVRPFLPRAQQDDILAELTEDIQSQIDDRETELGRKLDEDEIAGIIKKRGQPIMVASGYGPRQSLIGPAWFPAYRFVLNVVLFWILVPTLIGAFIVYFTAPNPNSALLDLVLGLPRTVLITFGVITLIFACLDRYQFHTKAQSLQTWDPRKLPPVPVAPRNLPGPRSVAIGELVWGIIFTLGWIYLARFHPSLHFEGFRLSLTPVWQNNFWPLLLLMMSGIPAGCIGLLRPSWTRLHSGMRLLIDGYSLTLIGVMFKAGTWIEIASAKLPAARVAEIARGYSLGIRIAFIVISIVVIADVLQQVYQMLRANSPRPWTANGFAAS
jgi:hypothetical protein